MEIAKDSNDAQGTSPPRIGSADVGPGKRTGIQAFEDIDDIWIVIAQGFGRQSSSRL